MFGVPESTNNCDSLARLPIIRFLKWEAKCAGGRGAVSGRCSSIDRTTEVYPFQEPIVVFTTQDSYATAGDFNLVDGF
jgi:hypothetical protein